VRLKVTSDSEYLFNFHISIPFGAIKRVRRITETKEPIRFQFLLVRLKEASAEIEKIKAEAFQFLLVRLKDSFSNFKIT